MSTNIYRLNTDTDQYEVVGTFHDDGTVEGDDPLVERLRTAVTLIESQDEDPANWVQPITERLVKHWDNGFYRIGWS